MASFDLHVLGAPPAFVLSQDQTLSFIPDITDLFPERNLFPKKLKGRRSFSELDATASVPDGDAPPLIRLRRAGTGPCGVETPPGSCPFSSESDEPAHDPEGIAPLPRPRSEDGACPEGPSPPLRPTRRKNILDARTTTPSSPRQSFAPPDARTAAHASLPLHQRLKHQPRPALEEPTVFGDAAAPVRPHVGGSGHRRSDPLCSPPPGCRQGLFPRRPLAESHSSPHRRRPKPSGGQRQVSASDAERHGGDGRWTAAA
jgi:hypothetical protein